jgi:hypothetical protein
MRSDSETTAGDRDLNDTHLRTPEPTPVFLFAHGSTMMLGEDSEPAHIWESVGAEAIRRGVKRIVMMVGHITVLEKTSHKLTEPRVLTGMSQATWLT